MRHLLVTVPAFVAPARRIRVAVDGRVELISIGTGEVRRSARA
ncbi:MAG TPA: hypothetical protein VFZ11_09810 [Gemmatimonadaceae bacterium]